MGTNSGKAEVLTNQAEVSGARILAFPQLLPESTPRWYRETLRQLESDTEAPAAEPEWAPVIPIEDYAAGRASEASETAAEPAGEAVVLSALDGLETKRRMQEAPLRAAAFWDLTKYIFKAYGVTRETLHDDRTASAMRLLWAAKRIVSPITTAPYLERTADIPSPYSNEVTRDLIAKHVNPETIGKIASTPQTRPFLQELGEFVIDPNTYYKPKVTIAAPPMTPPKLRLVK